ncbi:hypothetical protein Smp_157330 [Schistosoma mansoni]|uniref:hypothetical protein n=1 Tax=Schistosoma mansoni TaxID=6183 RepID=UPI0001A61F40|nr:hypothetical protein Smp_157330 [Schistosoma mansoni]|eukprot:XP_018650315.1 hypothetical protein Smp_157330 [Schistosoma mansoni]
MRKYPQQGEFRRSEKTTTIFSTDYDYSPRKNMKKFIPKYLQQQRAYSSKNRNRRRTRHIKNILTYQNTSDSCIFYLTLNSNKLIGPFIFHPHLNQEQDKYTDIFMQSGKINAFNPKDLLNMRNHREIPVSKVQITDQILDAAYDLERFILDETRRIHNPTNPPYVDHNLTQIFNDLVGNTQFTITATPVVQNELFVKTSNKSYKKQITNLYRITILVTDCEQRCIEGPDEKVNESTFTWHAKLNALLDQYRSENEILKSQNLILARSQSVLREERERMNREQEELSRELANVKKKLAQSPTQCPIHYGYRRSNIPVPNNGNYSVHDCSKHPILNKQDGGLKEFHYASYRHILLIFCYDAIQICL